MNDEFTEPARDDPNPFFTTETSDAEHFARAMLEAQTFETQLLEMPAPEARIETR